MHSCSQWQKAAIHHCDSQMVKSLFQCSQVVKWQNNNENFLTPILAVTATSMEGNLYSLIGSNRGLAVKVWFIRGCHKAMKDALIRCHGN